MVSGQGIAYGIGVRYQDRVLSLVMGGVSSLSSLTSIFPFCLCINCVFIA